MLDLELLASFVHIINIYKTDKWDIKTMKKSLTVVFGIIALCSILTVLLLLQPASPTSQDTLQPTPHTLQSAIGNATNFLEETREPYTLLMLNVIYRRFGITAFADALQHYDQVLAESPQEAPLLRVFRRIADYDNPLQAEDLQSVSVNLDRVTVPALYCDRLGLPGDYFVMLNNAASGAGGEYMLTHALLATIWLQENGNGASLSVDFIKSLYSANAALIGDEPVVNDLELEAAAFLYLAGQGALVDDAFVQYVIAAQNNDGGWLLSSDTPGNSTAHTTVLGLLLLLHVEFPADSYPPMLATASSHEGVSLNPTDYAFSVAAYFLLVPSSRRKIGNLA